MRAGFSSYLKSKHTLLPPPPSPLHTLNTDASPLYTCIGCRTLSYGKDGRQLLPFHQTSLRGGRPPQEPLLLLVSGRVGVSGQMELGGGGEVTGKTVEEPGAFLDSTVILLQKLREEERTGYTGLVKRAAHLADARSKSGNYNTSRTMSSHRE